MFRAFAFVLLAATACYRSSADADHCNLSCSESSPCPNGLRCNGTQCSIDGRACDEITPDGSSSTRVCAGSPAGLLGEVCFDPVPPVSPVASGVISTDMDIRCQVPIDGDIGACVLVVDRVDENLRAEGSRGLVLWGPGTLVIAGVVDVGSRAAGLDPDLVGAGADDGSCPSDAIAGVKNGGSASGGAGGSFGSTGGNGGSVNNTAVAGAMPIAFIGDLRFRGGCRGGRGGNTGAQENGGPSGGAVYLMAVERIEVTGVIDASGAGAASAQAVSGGGGGGSGGLIGFDAPSLLVDNLALVIALGGGGSSGGAPLVGGNEGHDPSRGNGFLATPTGPGCSGQTNVGGAGGNGLAVKPSNGGNANSATNCGAGGGGGGNGLIRVFAPDVDLGVTSMRPPPNVP